MNQRKPNRPLGHTLALAALLCICVLVVSTGTAFARYRTEKTKDITFSVRELEQAWFGKYCTITQEDQTETEVFQHQENFSWETVDGASQLELVVANGMSEDRYAKRDLEVRIRILATLGVLNDMEPAEISLTITEQGQSETIQAVSTAIVEGTALHHTYGDGWIYTIQNADGEVTRTLPGDRFSEIGLTITIKGVTPQEAAQVQPLLLSRVTG